MELELISYIKQHGLQNLCERYHINAKYHNKYPQLVLLKYSQIDAPMSEKIVQQARGIILDSQNTWQVVCYTFDKFFNYGEGNAAPIDWSTATVYEKVDGSLCQLYWYDNQWQVATSGTPDASGAVGDCGFTFQELFWKVWKELGYQFPNPPSWEYGNSWYCYSFELCTPYNRVIVPHKTNRIVLHGVRTLHDLAHSPTSKDLKVWDFNVFRQSDPQNTANFYGWECVQTFPIRSWDSIIEVSKELDPLLQEGYVVKDANFNRVKVKTPQYVTLAHMRDGMSVRRMIELIRSNESSEFLTYFPEWKDIYQKVKSAYDNLLDKTISTFQAIQARTFQGTRKDFALIAGPLSGSSLLFGMLDGENLKEMICNMSIQRLEQLLGLKNIKLIAEE